MRIAYLINQYPKVSHSFIRREILALEHAGHPVLRMALRGWDAETVDAADRDEQAGTRYLLQAGPLQLAWALVGWVWSAPGRLWRAFKLATQMGRRGAIRPIWVHWVYLAEACLAARWLERDGATHLHAHFGTNAAEVAMLVNVLLGLPYSFTVHGPEEFDHPLAIGLPEKCLRAAFVAAVSSFGRSQIYRWLPSAHWSKVHVVHCGVDADFLDKPPFAPSTALRLVCIGRLCEQKGQLLLLQAARRVLDEGVNFQLVLAGDGEMRADVEALIDELRLREHVTVTGWINGDQVRQELAQARALVLPSFAEGLPVVLMEAMAVGRPVLTTSIAGIPELVLDGECGWLFPAGDVERLANAMRACLQADPETLHAMGTAARARCQARHAVGEQARILADLFASASRTVVKDVAHA
jgi:colanic acid/amylovoran biosynthesis glycosyltransferase